MAIFNKAIPILLDDNINIPKPGSILSGTASNAAPGGPNETIITDNTVDYFQSENPISGGDVIYVDSNATNRPESAHQVVSVTDANTLIVNPAVAGIATPFNYKIYRANGSVIGGPDTTEGNEGYCLLGPFATSTILNVIPAGQSDPVFIKPNDSLDSTAISSLKVQRVLSTGSVNVDEYGLVGLEVED